MKVTYVNGMAYPCSFSKRSARLMAGTRSSSAMFWPGSTARDGFLSGGFLNEFNEIVIGSESLVNPVEVNHIIASVDPTGDEERIEPDDRDSKALDVVQFGNHTLDVTDSVTI